MLNSGIRARMNRVRTAKLSALFVVLGFVEVATLTTAMSHCALAMPKASGKKSHAATKNDSRPDLVLIHGNVLTVDASDSITQAVAIKSGKIIAVGTDEDISRLIGGNTRVLDFHGRTAPPGLFDGLVNFAAG